jgi:dCTP deaminase
MISDREIIRRLISDDATEQIIISPMISAPEQIGPSSVDVHLGTDFLVVERSDRVQFDPLMTEAEYKEWLRHIRSTSRYSVLEQFILHSGEFALAATLEFIVVPPTLVAHIDGRSSWARQGLKVHSTAGDVHPGSRGFVVFELENVGPVPIALYPGLAIAQLTFDGLDGEVLEDYSRRTQSSYSGVFEMLWSTYPHDSIVRAMRRLKEQGARHPASMIRTRDSVASNSDERFLPDSEGTSRYGTEEESELIEAISGALDEFDKTDLLSVLEPMIAEDATKAPDLLGLSEEGLRRFIAHRAEELAITNPPSLRVMHKLVIAFLRLKLRTL